MNDHPEILHFHLFSGLGGGARGFNRGEARVGNLKARFRCLGGIDVDPAAVRDFSRLAGVAGTVLDLFTREQYRAFHGCEPPSGWREATPADLRAAAGGEHPHILFTSPPCKGLSGLLSNQRSQTDKYQALNQLTLRGAWLALEAWSDNPPEFFLLENVPRIMNRGRHLLDQISALLRQYGYAVAETTHDCGVLGGLAQSRKRFLLVARHIEKVPPFLYEPAKKPLCSVGSLLEKFPLPGDLTAGPMHRVPALQWKTWVRLAFVEAGTDWRSLKRLAIENGCLRDYLLMPEMRRTVMGVCAWRETSNTITGDARPSKGKFTVADPRFFQSEHWHHGQQYGVHRWGDTSGTVTGQQSPGQGRFAVADPRINGIRHNNIYRVTRWDGPSPTVTARTGPTAGGLTVADPRPAALEGWNGGGKYRVTRFCESTGTVIAASTTGNGAFAVADPRLPEASERLTAIIRAEDGTWHRPFSTLELAALQGLVDPDEHIELEGLSDSAWRERIGNAVPAPAAEAIAGVMGRTLLLAWSGETFQLDTQPIWVRPIALALATDIPSIDQTYVSPHARD